MHDIDGLGIRGQVGRCLTLLPIDLGEAVGSLIAHAWHWLDRVLQKSRVVPKWVHQHHTLLRLRRLQARQHILNHDSLVVLRLDVKGAFDVDLLVVVATDLEGLAAVHGRRVV